MERVKNNFNIKNLEQISGIKAHTIRIWEKRYKLLEPQRTDTNIRLYDLENLQKLLNVTLLYNAGVKISKIAELSTSEINKQVQSIAMSQKSEDAVSNLLKLAMVNFDQKAFSKVLDDLLENNTFKEVFVDVLIPFMNDLGILWLSNSISPSHEHFATSLIKQKIHSLCDELQKNDPTKKSITYVLYLPDNEIHELGLLYLNYEILSLGFPCIFLGQSVPIESLSNLFNLEEKIVFISYFTVEPAANKIDGYLQSFADNILSVIDSELWVLGPQTQHITNKLPNIRSFTSIPQILSVLHEQK